jgi:hypothetical protein
MLKLTAGVLAIVLAGSASAAGWRSLRIDASSEQAFNESVGVFREKLPYVRHYVFVRSLQDVWLAGTEAARAAGRDYTLEDYLRDLDGLGYKDVIELTDPSGATAKRYRLQGYAMVRAGSPAVQPGAGQPRAAWYPPNPPREAGQSLTRGSFPNIGLNPWQR